MERERSEGPLMRCLAIAACAVALVAAMPPASAQTPSSRTLDRIRDASIIRFGYRTDARPFAYRDNAAIVSGYSIALCQRVADAIRRELNNRALSVEWVPVTLPDRFRAVDDGRIDLLCGADTVTLDRRRDVAFSIPIFPGGIGAMVRSDAPTALRDVLNGRGQSFRPIWRANATQVLTAKAFSAVAGTTAEKWLAAKIDELEIATTVVPSITYEEGAAALLARRVDGLFGERAILLDAAHRRSGRDLVVLGRLFTNEPLALAMVPGDEPFRLLVDHELAEFYRSGDLSRLYTMWFGEPDESALTFFKWSTPTD